VTGSFSESPRIAANAQQMNRAVAAVIVAVRRLIVLPIICQPHQHCIIAKQRLGTIIPGSGYASAQIGEQENAEQQTFHGRQFK
jgi:hypothetical protein